MDYVSKHNIEKKTQKLKSLTKYIYKIIHILRNNIHSFYMCFVMF